MKKTIVELDLVGYGSIASTLEENLGSSAVATLNAQIQAIVDHGLGVISLPRHASVASTTGDGAILILERASDAHHFALAVHEHTKMQNRGKLEATARRFFRIGAATGDITMESRSDRGFDIAGITIARAVRLEAAAQPGELIVDVNTFDSLPPTLSLSYSKEVTVLGKRNEKFAAYRCLMNSEAPQQSTSQVASGVNEVTGNRRSILGLLPKLHPSNLDRLVFLLEIPIAAQPHRSLTVRDKERHLLNYSSGTQDGLVKLESELQYLIEKQSAEFQPPDEPNEPQPILARVTKDVRIDNSTVGQIAIVNGDNNIIS